MESQVEVIVGKRSWEHKGQQLFEKVRFKGESLGHYMSDTSLSEDRLTKHETFLTLYRVPDGYRVSEGVLESRRRREQARWSRKESTTTLLPYGDASNDNADGLGLEYGVYSEEEARRKYPRLFSAVGEPNVRYLD